MQKILTKLNNFKSLSWQRKCLFASTLILYSLQPMELNTYTLRSDRGYSFKPHGGRLIPQVHDCPVSFSKHTFYIACKVLECPDQQMQLYQPS